VTQPKPESFLEELKRRKVVRVAIVYAAVAWGVAQVADVALSTFGAPLWVMQSVMVLLALGFPLAVVLALGIRRDPDGDSERRSSNNELIRALQSPLDPGR
jgi:adenylate cyclase